MKVLNNVVANDIRLFLMDTRVSIGRLHSLCKYIGSELGGLVYNAQTLMVDIDKIVNDLPVKSKYNMEILNILLSGLGIIYTEDSVFYEIDKDKEGMFNVIYNETLNKNINKVPELTKTLIHGGISVSYIAELIINDAMDITNQNDETLLEMSKWDAIYTNVIKDDEEYTELLAEVGECILDHLKIRKDLSKESKDLVYKNARLYKMIK